jgi:hypothetical protein
MKKRIFGATAASVMLAGTALAFAAAPAGAAVTTVGTCSGTRGLATAKSSFIWPGDGKNAGITDKNHDETVTTKGIHAQGGTVGTVGGSCSFGVVAGDKGLTTLPATLSLGITKWGAKTVSPVSDCAQDTDTTEWPLTGKVSYTFADLTKTDAYVTANNPTGTPADVVNLTGIVAKGRAVGASINTQVSYTPVLKDKTVTTDFVGTPGVTLVTEILVPSGIPANKAVVQGYAVDPGALGCQVTSEPVTEATNLRTLVLGGASPSPLLASPLSGTTFTIGAA